MAVISKKRMPDSPSGEMIEQRFRRLSDAWHGAVAHHSSTTARNNHPAYQAIIALGPDVVPVLLRDLEVTHNHWFCALRALTGADPVPHAAAGNIPKMVEIWLQWAKEHGYQW